MERLILGGGLGGLSAAYYLLRRFPKEPIKMIESASLTGGWIKSFPVQDGIIFEQGPRTIRPRGEPGANTLALVEDLGLENEVFPILSTSPAASNRMVYAKGQLHSLPSSLKGLFQKQELFSKPLYKFFLNDLKAMKKSTSDESIYDFVDRRFGGEIADYLISPLICGICAGNAKEISVNFIMRQLFEYEQSYGNIYKGLLRNAFGKKLKSSSLVSALSKRASAEKWSVYSFKDGLQTLTTSLEREVVKRKGDILLNSKCERIDFSDSKVCLYLDDGKKFNCDQLISSLPAHVLGDLLPKEHHHLAEMLKSITCANVAVVNLHYNKSLIERPGFGFLVAPKEQLPILGVIYDSCCFPRGDNTVLTVMMGGYWFEHYFGSNPSEETLLKIAQEQLSNIMGIKDEPAQYKVNILWKSIPQYTIGHNKNLQDILDYIKAKNLSLLLCGSSYSGVGVNDVILSSKMLVDRT